MKTIIIAGTFTYQRETVENASFEVYTYKVDLYGQTPTTPEMTYIKALEIETRIGIHEVERICRAEYCKYFNTSLSDIISLNSITKT